jgi:uncharacterized protein (DUF1684 family)
MITAEYREKIDRWHEERNASIRRENSWLALSGLFWLQQGENRFGSDPANEIVLPVRLPARLGTFHFDGEQVRLQVGEGQEVRVNGESVREVILQSDSADSPSFIALDGIRMVVIERPQGVGIRMWDNLRSERQTQPPREWFPVNEAMRVPALYTRYAQSKPVQLPNIFGEVQDGSVDGQVSFELEGRAFTLDVTELPDQRLDIQFRDETSGGETYPSGRYYVTEDCMVDGRIMLDFNFAYSPPCAFTGFATCVFAPIQNHLQTRVEAGEIYHSQH